jgi:organic radical activating enzyme
MSTPDMRQSYTAADSIPTKLLFHGGVFDFSPIHIQWMPTNRCNLSCSCCSCAERDKSLEMDIDLARKVIANFAERGCKAATITGGGEPLMHPKLADMLDAFFANNIKVGLVTNGLLLPTFSQNHLATMAWCRISSMDDREWSTSYWQALSHLVRQTDIDWAFSHVASREPNLKHIEALVDFANEHNFTHVRIVGDLLAPEQTGFGPIWMQLKGKDRRVIYQPRKQPTRSDSCMIGYVKPVIAPDFKMYLCCGVQYALAQPSRDMPEELCMGSALDLDAVYSNIKAVTVPCVRCYYGAYNTILHAIHNPPDHLDFI